MSTRRSARRTALPAVTTFLALVVAGCGGGPSSPAPPDGPPSTLTAPTATPTPDPTAPGSGTVVPTDLPDVVTDLAADLQELLDVRAGAVLARDREQFLAGLAGREALRTTEAGYFDNIAQLPLSTFSYELLPASLVRTGGAYWGVVEVLMQLTPYDVAAVRTIDRFRFAPVGGGSFVISSTTDRDWEAENLGLRQPWDMQPITVRERPGVLGIFDTADLRERAGIVASVERGIPDVASRVPYDAWGSQAVVYALSDPQFLASFDELPGGDPQALDGVAFTVPTGTDETSVASTRIALKPELLAVASARRVDPDLDRLVRHELVHVAVAEHDDAAPVWLSEGIAEWVSVQALPPSRRDVPERAIRQAVRGKLGVMPSDESFNDADATVHYALSWWVCEWLAATYDDAAPWTVLEAFEVRAGDDPDVIVRDLLDLSVDELAERGGELLAQTYASEPPEPPEPAESPTGTPSTGPSSDPSGRPSSSAPTTPG